MLGSSVLLRCFTSNIIDCLLAINVDFRLKLQCLEQQDIINDFKKMTVAYDPPKKQKKQIKNNNNQTTSMKLNN